MSVFFYSYSTLLVSDADRDAVHVVLSEWLNAATLAVRSDAACRNAILLGKHLNYSSSTLRSKTIVDLVVTSTSISITSNSQLLFWILAKILNKFLHLCLLLGRYLAYVDGEEHVDTQRLNNLHFFNNRSWLWLNNWLWFWLNNNRSS